MKLVSLSIMVVVAAAFMRQTAYAAERVVCQTSDSVQVCTITEPDVNHDHKEYPIYFHPGSFVTVHAGGCVQSGGVGQTWHRYVDPSGPNADHLYHGRISYLGPGGLRRFSPAAQTVQGWTFQVPKDARDNVKLTLGFEDDDYGNNGYWGHDRDNGPGGQCPTPGSPYAELGKPAWVTISISATGTATPNQAMDLVSDTVDPNNLPLNPWWAFEKGEDHVPGDPQTGPPDPDKQCGLRYIDPDNVDLGINLLGEHCTTQAPSVNQGTGFNGELCRHAAQDGVLAGHLNWFVSTYRGKIRWDDWSGTFKPLYPTKSGDDDYNFKLFPESKTGLTAARPEWIGLEFDSDEVVDRIDKGWWNDFHDLVNIYPGSDGAAGQRIYDAPAIAIGLMGLDSEHGAYSELHPVYGLAIHINADAGHVGTDDWVFLARNFGNEGYCANGDKMAVPEMKTLSFFIPRDGAIGDDSANPTALNELFSTSDNNAVAVSFVSGGALITFNVGSPHDQTVYSGRVQFHWQLSPRHSVHGNAPPRAIRSVMPTKLSAAVTGRRPVRSNSDDVLVNGFPQALDIDAENLKTSVLDHFPAARKLALNAILTKSSIPHAVHVHRVKALGVGGRLSTMMALASPIYKAKPRYIRPTRLADPDEAAREAQVFKLYCETYPGGKSPDLTMRSCAHVRIPSRPIVRH